MITNGMAARAVALGAGLMLAATLARADDYLSPVHERVRLSMGVEFLSNTTDLRLGQQHGFAGHADQRGERSWPRQIVRGAQVPGHGAGGRAAPAAF